MFIVLQCECSDGVRRSALVPRREIPLTTDHAHCLQAGAFGEQRPLSPDGCTQAIIWQAGKCASNDSLSTSGGERDSVDERGSQAAQLAPSHAPKLLGSFREEEQPGSHRHIRYQNQKWLPLSLVVFLQILSYSCIYPTCFTSFKAVGNRAIRSLLPHASK